MRHPLLLLGAALTMVVCSVTGTAEEAVLEVLRNAAISLESPDDLQPLYDRVGDARYVLLGEASHGTREFYTWRAAISKRLLEDHGFSFVAVEGDWEACYRLNRYVKDLPGAGSSAREVLESFDRWPLWMWANEEIAELAEWLREFNADRSAEDRVGFYGMDIYGAEDSFRALQAFLAASDADEAARVAELIEPFGPYAGSPRDYAQFLAQGGEAMNEAIERAVEKMRRAADALADDNDKAFFNAKQHALVLKRAEQHYRGMLMGGAASWNARVGHFYATVERLMDFYGPGARAIVWAHNTHIGDARATDMAQRGRQNIGQLVRQNHGEDAAVLVGFGTHRGRVLAGASWEAPMQRMIVPEAQRNSAEDLFYRLGHDKALVVFEPNHREGPLGAVRGHRAIGVIYDPQREHLGNYVPTILPQRYDAFIFLAETGILTPVHE